MTETLSNLEQTIGIKFKDKELLKKSLIHKSFNNLENNEKLEFLGDRVLGLSVANVLLKIYPTESEGIIDKKFANLVKNSTTHIISGSGHMIMIEKAFEMREKILEFLNK